MSPEDEGECEINRVPDQNRDALYEEPDSDACREAGKDTSAHKGESGNEVEQSEEDDFHEVHPTRRERNARSSRL